MLRLFSKCGIRVASLFTSSTLRSLEVKMPALSPTMTSGTIVKWCKKEGEEVAPGDVLCEVQTDKAVVSMEMDEEGTLAKILVPEGSGEVVIGSLIAVMAEAGEDWRQVSIPSSADIASPAAQPAAPTAPEASALPVQKQSAAMGPATRLLLQKYELKPDEIPHSGPHGTLLKGDVLKYVSGKPAAPVATKPATPPPPAPPPTEVAKAETTTPPSSFVSDSIEGDYTDIPLTGMRRTIAKRLTESKQQLPHAYGTIDMDMSRVLQLRKELKDDGIRVSVNDFIVKSAAQGLQTVPEVNVQWLEAEGRVRQLEDADVAVAVATESGLITPIVFAAQTLGVAEISAKIQELAEKAKANKLQLHEFQGGSFTVSNLGMFGISEFTAIINPPQAAILAIGGSVDSLSSDMQLVPRMKVTLCFDNRAVDEAAACRFLVAFRDFMEDPETLLLGRLSTASSRSSCG